jgi:arylsulfatase A-like enzyme
MLAVDRMLAAVENEMAAQGRTDTLYLLVDDNGMDFGQHRLSGKTTPYSTPIPLMASWSRRGLMQRVETSYVSNIDIGPTLAEVAGTTMPQADGISFAPLLTDQPWSPTRDAILIDMPPADAVPDRHNWSGLWTTDRHWLYVEWATDERELYDLTVDPWQLQNLQGDPAYATTEADLSAELAVLLQQASGPPP